MTVGVTSFLRFKIKYRVFYIVHHIVFATYILTIVHTIDEVERQRGGRSQAYQWFSASLLLYASDRAAMYLNNRYHTNIVSSHAIGGESEEKMVIMKAKRPDLFFFHPGQYVYIKVPHLDNRWHPFSIGSAPESETLDFYVKAYGEESWSGRLFASIKEMEKESNDSWNEDADQVENFKIEILGPYGVGLGEKMKHSRALIIGSGTGFVPCLSFLREHINQCMTIDAKGRDKDAAKRVGAMRQLTAQRSFHSIANTSMRGGMGMGVSMRSGMGTSMRDGMGMSMRSGMGMGTSMRSGMGMGTSFRDGMGTSMRSGMGMGMDVSVRHHMNESLKIIANANMAKRQIYANTILMLGPMLGLLMVGLTLSWNQLPSKPNAQMENFLIAGTIIFQCSFFILSLFKFWMGRGGYHDLWVYMDFVMVVVGAVGACFWSWKDVWGGNFPASNLAYYTLLSSYMIFRFISHVIGSSDSTVEEMNRRQRGLVVLDKVKFVWISRSALSIAQIYPEISNIWDEFVNVWGQERAAESCEIVIHCTDKNKEACDVLLGAVQSTNLYTQGAIRFGRPSIEALFDTNTQESLEYSAANDDVGTSTLLAFCGSERLGKVVKEAKIYNDIFLSMTGYTQHVVDLFIQSYGGLVSADKEDWNDGSIKTIGNADNHDNKPKQNGSLSGKEVHVEVSEQVQSEATDDSSDALDSNTSSKRSTVTENSEFASINHVTDINAGVRGVRRRSTRTLSLQT